MSLPWPPLLIISDRHQARLPLQSIVANALAGGCRWISLREKDMVRADRLALLQQLVDLAQPWGASVGVHGDVATARAGHVRHVHLPAGTNVATARHQLGPEALIGISAHKRSEAVAAQVSGADYCTVSPIFPSRSKPGYGPPIGLEALNRITAELAIPVVALGGVEDQVRISECLEAGVAGVAVMGAVMRSRAPREQVQRLLAAFCGQSGILSQKIGAKTR